MTNALRLFGLSRLGFGAWLLLAPARPGQLWFGSGELPASTAALLRSVGARDVALGIGLALDPRPRSAWVAGGILADAADAAAASLNMRRLPKANALTGLIGGGLYAAIGSALWLRGRGRRSATR